jgi:site-specific DNA recombinase
MKQAVAYARYSSENQREESITAQLRAIQDYARKNEIEIIKEYIDEAKSATTDDRPSFLQMVKDIKSKRLTPHLVLVHKTNRFARNRYDAAVYKRAITQAGVERIIAVDQPIDDTPEGALLESLLEGLDEYYSKNLAKETIKGLKENAYQAKTTGGRPPLGYDFDKDGKYVINEKEALIVKRIFDGVLNGASYADLIVALNKDGYTTKVGKSFGKNSVHDILRNERYAGTYVYMKGSKNAHRNVKRDDTIRVEDAIPAIIDKENFAEVQRILDGRKHKNTPRKRKHLFILSGRVVCGECGGSYIGNVTRTQRGNGEYLSYRCDKKHRTKSCDNRYMDKEVLENSVLDFIESAFSIDSIDQLADDIMQMLKERSNVSAVEMFDVKRELRDLQQKTDNLIRAIEDGSADYSMLGNRLREIKELQTAKQKRLNEIMADQTIYSREQVIEFLTVIQQAVQERDDIDKCRLNVERFVEKIEIFPDRIDVKLNIILPGNVLVSGGSPKGSRLLTKTCLRVGNKLLTAL